jgi:hypothetical protein
MSVEINDGIGNGYKAQVDSDHRLHVNSVTRTQDEQAALLGVAYNMSTGSIGLTTDGESCIAYMKYTGEDPFVIKEIIMIPSSSTGGTGNALIKVKKNPTTGTIIDNAVSFTAINNRDFSSSNDINNDALLYKGGEGDTITNGTDFAITTRDNFDEPIVFDATNIILKKGNSIGVCVTPPSNNTLQSWVVAIVGFVETATVSGDLK